jgi:hypothetical protein
MHFLDQVTRFDNIAGVPGVSVSPIGIYDDDMIWQGMSLAHTGGLQNLIIVVPNRQFQNYNHKCLVGHSQNLARPTSLYTSASTS